MIRGEATATSDLDLVVLFENIDHAYRESFFHDGWPVEAFVHDEHSIEFYFIEKDLASGVGSLMWMVHEAEVLPGLTLLNRRVKQRADTLIANGPAPWRAAEIDASRYAITGLLDDLVPLANGRGTERGGEYLAVVAAMHHAVGNHSLRCAGHWGATAKTIPRRLAVLDADLARRFDDAFVAAFDGRVDRFVAFVDEILEACGGRLFDGYSAHAERDAKRSPPPGA